MRLGLVQYACGQEDMLQYREYMAQALELARKGAGWVDPNPLVGAVVVSGGEVLATGYHDRYRGPHAERMAFDYADAHGIDLTGATVIDTLEPCCHVGSQPACTALIPVSYTHLTLPTT